jgi:hypothetical protein
MTAINNYITLGGCKYKTSAATWMPKFDRPVQVRRLWNGNRDVTFGPGGMSSWTGDIIAPVTAAGDYGDIEDLRALYSEDTTQAFTDHYGVSYNVALIGSIGERSKLRMWDAASNEFLVPVILVMVSVVTP